MRDIVLSEKTYKLEQDPYNYHTLHLPRGTVSALTGPALLLPCRLKKGDETYHLPVNILSFVYISASIFP